MKVIIFLVDNTPSMLQQSLVDGVSISYLDLAKQAVKKFLKTRMTAGRNTYDRCLLVTFDTAPDHVHTGWGESQEQFMAALNALDGTGSLPVRDALSNVFALLNEERLAKDVDTYGCGRCPFKALYSFVVLITTNRSTPVMRTCFPSLPDDAPGAGLTKESYRWDQRLYALFLGKLHESKDAKKRSSQLHRGLYPKHQAIDKMCCLTGGWSRSIGNRQEMANCLDMLLRSIVMKLIVEFVSDPKGPANIVDISDRPVKSSLSYRGVPSQGSWPFPDTYPLDGALVPRDAHPKLRLLPATSEEPVWMPHFPVDRYLIGATSVITRRILSMPNQGKIWPVVIVPSRLEGEELPFGYLKRHAAEVHLHVLPYNYSELNRLLVANKSAGPLAQEFIKAIIDYRFTMPPYYCLYLRNALRNLYDHPVLNVLLPSWYDRYLIPYEEQRLVKAQKEAKEKRKAMLSHVSSRLARAPTSALQEPVETVKLAPELRLDRLIRKNPNTLQGRMDGVDHNLGETIVVPQQSSAQMRPLPDLTHRNLYRVHRSDLIDHYERLREAFYYSQNQASTDEATQTDEESV